MMSALDQAWRNMAVRSLILVDALEIPLPQDAIDEARADYQSARARWARLVVTERNLHMAPGMTLLSKSTDLSQ